MSETIKYDVFGCLETPVAPPEVRAEIDEAMRQINEQFTWTHGKLAFELFAHPMIHFAEQPLRPWQPLVGQGSTIVMNDRMNAALVLSFLRWVSTRLPDLTIRVTDESGLVRSSHLLVKDGRYELDEDGIACRRGFLARYGGPHAMFRFNDLVDLARAGGFFAPTSVKDYPDRSEIQQLRLSRDQYAELTVTEVAERLAWVWQRSAGSAN